MTLASGLVFRQPIPVQPMKAVTAVAVTERLTAGDIAAAGLIVGLAMLILGLRGRAGWISAKCPRPMVRAIQLGVGAKLALEGMYWRLGVKFTVSGMTATAPVPLFGRDSLIIAAAALAVLLFSERRSLPGLLAVFAAGFLPLYLGHPGAHESFTFGWPRFEWQLPTSRQWLTGLWHGASPQLPLTLLNSVLAVCASSADCFPGRGISAGRMAANVGVMNLIAVPFGGLPMCHGAGGLGALWRFGARTGGSVIMLGTLLMGAGLLPGGSLLSVIQQ